MFFFDTKFFGNQSKTKRVSMSSEWYCRTEMNLDLNLYLFIVRKINRLPPYLPEPIKWDGAPKQSKAEQLLQQQKIKQRNTVVKSTTNLKKKIKKEADVNSLLFISLLRNMFRAAYSWRYWRISNALTCCYSTLLRKQALFLLPVKPGIAFQIIPFAYQRTIR